MKPVAVITRASRGIGRAIALDLSRTHAVVATYKNRRDLAEALNAESGAEIVQCDVSLAGVRERLIEFTRNRFGRLDLLVKNAGTAPTMRRDLLESTEESFDELVATNLKGPHFLTQLVARVTVEQGAGRIVFVSSLSAYAASIDRGEYCISKAGLSMSVALWRNGLRLIISRFSKSVPVSFAPT